MSYELFDLFLWVIFVKLHKFTFLITQIKCLVEHKIAEKYPSAFLARSPKLTKYGLKWSYYTIV